MSQSLGMHRIMKPDWKNPSDKEKLSGENKIFALKFMWPLKLYY